MEAEPTTPSKKDGLLQSEDWWSVWIGAALIGLSLLGVPGTPAKIATWSSNPIGALPLASVAMTLGAVALLTTLAARCMGIRPGAFVKGFLAVALITTLAKTIGAQASLKSIGLGYALWALTIGLVIANTIGTPTWILHGARSELFIKVGLVMLGAEILLNRMMDLGGPGLMVAWLVTPLLVLIMWQIGIRLLNMPSKSLVIVIACATSVCGVSAAIAAAAASRAKREELSLAVGMTMIFTVGMMVAMPILAKGMGLTDEVAGAWIGGTVDSTGAVVASGAMLGAKAESVAAIVKMIQNILIGFIAFVIAIYWTSVIERDPSGNRPSLLDIWRRFPKFVLGFLGASLFFSLVVAPWFGEDVVDACTNRTKALRGWLFALAFVSIGLESDFKRLARQVVGGKPIVLYLIGQSLNMVMTLAAAYVAFADR